MNTLEAQRIWQAEFERLREACKLKCADIAADDQPNKLARQSRAQLELVQAACTTAPPRMLFMLYEALQDAWEADGALEALEIVSLEMQLEAVDDEIERRGLRQAHKIFLRTTPRRRTPWTRDEGDF